MYHLDLGQQDYSVFFKLPQVLETIANLQISTNKRIFFDFHLIFNDFS
jgi:hypothetical protein